MWYNSRKTAVIPLLWLDDYTICRIKRWNSLTAADCFCSSGGDAPAFPEPLDQTAGCGLEKGAFCLSRPGERAWGELNPAGQRDSPCLARAGSENCFLRQVGVF